MRLLAVLLLAAVASAGPREVLTKILVEPKARERAKLVATLAAEDIEAVRKSLLAGPLYEFKPNQPRKGEKLNKFGNVWVGYTFTVDGKRYRYAVDVPSSYSAKTATPLLFDPGHGSGAKSDDKGKAGLLGFFRGQAHKDWLVVRSEIVEVIGAGARDLPEDYCNVVFQEMFRDLASRFHIDPDRIVASGLSQTGFWTWMFGRMCPDRFAGLIPMSAISREVDHYPANFINVPVYVLHGTDDKVCRVSEPRKTCPLLARHGVDVKYVEIEGAAHDAGVWQGMSGGLAWLEGKPRVRYPKRISYSLQTVQRAWCYWLRVDAIEKEGDGRSATKPTAGIDGVIEGQTIRLGSEGVKRITLALAPEMLDLAKPLEVVWNGKTVFEGKVEPSLATLFEFVHEKVDWKQTFVAKLELKAP